MMPVRSRHGSGLPRRPRKPRAGAFASLVLDLPASPRLRSRRVGILLGSLILIGILGGALWRPEPIEAGNREDIFVFEEEIPPPPEIPPPQPPPMPEPPRILKGEPPAYPARALDRGLEGTVVALITIDTTGRVTNAEIERSGGRDFDQAVRESVRRTLFQPPVRNGRKLPARFRRPYEFRLEG